MGHMAELRPDLRFFATDLAGAPQNYPAGCQFQRADLERDRLPWAAGSMDAVTCLHLVEHLHDLTLLLQETARLLKPGGRISFQDPPPENSYALQLARPSVGNFPDELLGRFNPRAAGRVGIAGPPRAQRWLGNRGQWDIAELAPCGSLPVVRSFAASRQKFTARLHWLGWSAYLIARRPL